MWKFWETFDIVSVDKANSGFLNSPLPLKEMGILKKYILTLDYANCNIKTFDLHYLTAPVSILIPHHMGGFVSQSIGLVHWAL